VTLNIPKPVVLEFWKRNPTTVILNGERFMLLGNPVAAVLDDRAEMIQNLWTAGVMLAFLLVVVIAALYMKFRTNGES